MTKTLDECRDACLAARITVGQRKRSVEQHEILLSEARFELKKAYADEEKAQAALLAVVYGEDA